MKSYKITNKTNKLHNRDRNYNSNVNIELIDNMIKRVIEISPGESIILNIKKIPLSIYRLVADNLISIESFKKPQQVEKAVKKSTVKQEIKKPVKQQTVEKESTSKPAKKNKTSTKDD